MGIAFDVSVDRRQVELSGQGEGLLVQAGAAYDEGAGIRRSCEGDGFLEAVGGFAAGERRAALTGDHDVAAFG